MRLLFVFLFCVFLCPSLTMAEDQEPAPAAIEEETPAPELVAVGISLLNCVAPISVGDSPERIALEQNLPELTSESTALLIPAEGGEGRAFAIPDAMGNIFLAISNTGICRVLVRELNSEKFKDALNKVFDPTTTPWRKIRDDSKDGAITKSFVGLFNGWTLNANISVRDEPLENGLQALLIVSRIKDDINSFTFIE